MKFIINTPPGPLYDEIVAMYEEQAKRDAIFMKLIEAADAIDEAIEKASEALDEINDRIDAFMRVHPMIRVMIL